MGYYCTVPQCTSLAGKTKNVKFHRFPRDVIMADKWNIILKRGKPYTKYSKVCSLHFTQADYNVTTMGQWKTLSKDAVPSQNLPKLNPDGTVMVIRKSRTVKYKEHKKDDIVGDKPEKWSPLTNHTGVPLTGTPDRTVPSGMETHDSALSYRLQKLSDLANIISPHQSQQSPSPPQPQVQIKPKKQDAFMQTDPIQNEDEDQQQSYESSEKSYSPTMEYQYKEQEYKDREQFTKEQTQYVKEQTQYVKDQTQFVKDQTQFVKDQTQFVKDQTQYTKDEEFVQKKYEMPKDYTKPADDYIPQTNEEYNKEAEKYALERKSHNGYEKTIEYQKQLSIENNYQKIQDMYSFAEKHAGFETRTEFAAYQPTYTDSAEVLRGQQHNLQMLQEQHRINENQNFFNENHIKQEIDFVSEEEKYLYERNKDHIVTDTDVQSEYERQVMEQRLLQQMQVKQEPDASSGCESVMQPQTSPYYNTNGHTNVTDGYYSQLSRPGPELLIAKQNALAAHTQLWQNTMKRPFFYSETNHYNTPQLIHRYEDVTRIQQ
ncbi:uncharacterized protein [Epargyreus clarus]|uniref:uncharacterized protein isoform X2 n=1 Tax=Epargyreus clarus TaxID=520877 RepID=UPI003C2C7833